MIAFIQPFGLRQVSGGGRILQSLLQCEHPPVLPIDTSRGHSASEPVPGEIRVPLRPDFGRVERTRYHAHFGVLDRLGSFRFAANLKKVLREHRVDAVHLLHHSYDIVPVTRVVRDLNLPLFLSIHDDFHYTMRGHPFLNQIERAVGSAWCDAKSVFVISEEMGHEYARRYGDREFRVVTDGLAQISEAPQRRPERSLRLYFMGLFHYSYNANLRAVLDAMALIRDRHPDWEISVACRSNSISCPLINGDVPVHVLPFASEGEVEKDMLCADLLYQPLPMAEFAANFAKFSLSTKMITYLGSGLPILYHGPEDAAAFRLLERHQAAQLCTTLDPHVIARNLLDALSHRELIVTNALSLSRSQFMLKDQRRRFWQPFSEAVDLITSGIAERER